MDTPRPVQRPDASDSVSSKFVTAALQVIETSRCFVFSTRLRAVVVLAALVCSLELGLVALYLRDDHPEMWSVIVRAAMARRVAILYVATASLFAESFVQIFRERRATVTLSKEIGTLQRDVCEIRELHSQYRNSCVQHWASNPDVPSSTVANPSCIAIPEAQAISQAKAEMQLELSQNILTLLRTSYEFELQRLRAIDARLLGSASLSGACFAAFLAFLARFPPPWPVALRVVGMLVLLVLACAIAVSALGMAPKVMNLPPTADDTHRDAVLAWDEIEATIEPAAISRVHAEFSMYQSRRWVASHQGLRDQISAKAQHLMAAVRLVFLAALMIPVFVAFAPTPAKDNCCHSEGESK